MTWHWLYGNERGSSAFTATPTQSFPWNSVLPRRRRRDIQVLAETKGRGSRNISKAKCHLLWLKVYSSSGFNASYRAIAYLRFSRIYLVNFFNRKIFLSWRSHKYSIHKLKIYGGNLNNEWKLKQYYSNVRVFQLWCAAKILEIVEKIQTNF